MRILALGDPHGEVGDVKKISLKGIDLTLITGDLGKVNLARKRYFENLKRERRGLSKLKYDGKFNKKVHDEVHYSTINLLKYLSKFSSVYFIQGNVGISSVSNVKRDYRKYGIKLISTKKEIDKMKNVHLVKNVVRNINGLRIGFLEFFLDINWVQDFKPKNYKEELKKAKKETDKGKRILKRFGNHLDILICHQPPYKILDKVSSKYNPPKNWIGKHAGSKVILEYIKKYSPKYVFCGHIHEGEGKAKIGKTEVYNLGVAGYKIINL